MFFLPSAIEDVTEEGYYLLGSLVTVNMRCIESQFTAVLGIRDILVRIRIPVSVPLTNGSGSNSFLQLVL
jgi:hypothetical protein